MTDDDQPTIPVPHGPPPEVAKSLARAKSELLPDEEHKVVARIWLDKVRDTLRGKGAQ